MLEKLRDIFETEEQVQRFNEEITAFANAEHVKIMVQMKLLFVLGEQLVVQLLLRESFMQIYGLGTEWRPVQLSVVYGCRYPETRPRLYFESDGLNLNYTIPGRDYLLEVSPDWSEQSTLLDLLPCIAGFFQVLSKLDQPHRLGTYIRGELLGIENFIGNQASELYCVKIIMDQPLDRFLVLNRFDMLLLEPSAFQGYIRMVDVYALKSIISIHNSKNDPNKLMMLFRLCQTDMGCEVLTNQRQKLVTSILEKKHKAPNYDINQQVSKPKLNPQPIDIDTINQKIAIEQSKLDAEDLANDEAIDTLICLYNQAIEYCSLVTGSGYEEYLERLQRLLSRQSSSLNQKESIFPEIQIKEKQRYFYDKLHDLTQVTCASADLFDLV